MRALYGHASSVQIGNWYYASAGDLDAQATVLRFYYVDSPLPLTVGLFFIHNHADGTYSGAPRQAVPVSTPYSIVHRCATYHGPVFFLGHKHADSTSPCAPFFRAGMVPIMPYMTLQAPYTPCEEKRVSGLNDEIPIQMSLRSYILNLLCKYHFSLVVHHRRRVLHACGRFAGGRGSGQRWQPPHGRRL